MRYQFYREHKYVSAALNDVERLIAKTDFADTKATLEAKEAFLKLSSMLQGHAAYENNKLHPLLEKKHSSVHQHAGDDHNEQEARLLEIAKAFEAIVDTSNEQEKIEKGYRLYLTYRKFVGDNLLHLHEEETLILPQLQKLYSDEELEKVEEATYRIMTPEQLLHMVQLLFPHMNRVDRQAFLCDIIRCEPKKLIAIWPSLASCLPQAEIDQLPLKGIA